MSDEATSATSEAAARVGDLLQRLVVATGVEAKVEVREDEDGIFGEFLGEELGLVVGHHGQTLDAIQHIAYRVAFKGAGARKHVEVDAAGYRERRATALKSAADQAAEAALDESRPVALEPMSALERKVVHEHLKSRRDVETYSEGQEPARRLVVAPLVD